LVTGCGAFFECAQYSEILRYETHLVTGSDVHRVPKGMIKYGVPQTATLNFLLQHLLERYPCRPAAQPPMDPS
jgi:hypothetical protein